MLDLPKTGFVRLPTVLQHVPVGRSTWWAGVADGRYPAPVKLSNNITAWRAEDILDLIARLGRPLPEGSRPGQGR